MKFQVQKYLESSSIHGLAYISKRFHFIERVFWLATLIFSAICTLMLIIQLAIKLKNFPIVIYLSDTSIPVSEINFPAVTICPDFIPFRPYISRYYKTKSIHYKYEKHTAKHYYYEQAEHLDESEDERKFMDRYLKFNYNEFLNRLENGEISPNKLGIKILKRLQVIDLITKRGVFQKLNFSVTSGDFLDVINEFDKEFLYSSSTIGFSWMDDSHQHVSEIITSHGLCFTFNMAFSNDVVNLTTTSEDFNFQLIYIGGTRYEVSRPPQNLPRRTSTSLSGLYLSMFLLYDYYIGESIEVITSDVNGFQLYIHDPFEFPSSRTKSIFVKHNQRMNILIEAQFNSVEESLESYDPVDRNCYLDNERQLKFFKQYTKTNCIQECLSDFMISRCGCVEFFMIRNSTTRICRGNEKNCFDNARNDFENHQNSCGCLQPCNYIRYDFEVTDMGFIVDALWININQSFMQIGAMIQYKDNKFNKFIRKQQFGVTDFLSFVGGLLGLFAGFSVLSLVELFYWFVVRSVLHSSQQTTSRVVPFNRSNHLTKDEPSKATNIPLKFLNESSIHGLKFLIKFKFSDKILWIFSITMSMTTCFYLISRTREKIPDSRVIAIDDNLKAIENINFPAVTIVPEFYLDTISHETTCNLPFSVNDDLFKDELRKVLTCAFCTKMYVHVFTNRTEIDLKPFVLNMLKEKSRRNWFQQQISILNVRFQPIYAEIRTSRGMGYTFGLLDADELLNFETIHESFRFYKNITTKSHGNLTESTEKLLANNRMKTKFIIEFKKINTIEQICIQLGMAVHDSETMPTFYDRSKFLAIPYGTKLNIEVTPEIIKTDANLKELNPSIRECYFDGEKMLKFFKKYSQQNCITECLADFVYERCNCNDFMHPFENPKFCGEVGTFQTRRCPYIARSAFYQQDPTSADHKCSCLPTCNSITYHVQYFSEISGRNDSISINLRMNTEDAILYRRYQQFTFSDVISYVGGLLGLFAGISMLSIVEIFYFFVIRVAVNIFRSFRH